METTNIVFRDENGQTVTTSMLVAETFGKQHKHVLRDIDNLGCSKEFFESNFGLSVRIRELPSGYTTEDRFYYLTKDGFVILAMGYTGDKAMAFKEKYIDAFNSMERTIQQGSQLTAQFMETQMQMMNQMMNLCNSMMQRLDKLEKQPAPMPVAVHTGLFCSVSENKWRKYVMNTSDVRAYYPHFLKVNAVSEILRQRGLPVYQPTLYQWLRDKGYLRTEQRAYNRPSAECERKGLMISTWSGTHRSKHPGRQNFVPYIHPGFVSHIEEEMRAEAKIAKAGTQLSLPLGKEAQG